MLLRRYFPGFIDADDTPDVVIEKPSDALKIDWIKAKIDSGSKIEINGWAVQSVYPDAKYVIALLLTDDGKEYIK